MIEPLVKMKRPIMENSIKRQWIQLNYLYLLLVLLGCDFILSTAMFMQYYYHELPCPLCLSQRLAFFGICFPVMLSFRHGYSLRHMGFSILCALFLLIVSVRQSLLDIVVRPGDHWIGSAIFGLHMPIWSVIISLLILLAYGD